MSLTELIIRMADLQEEIEEVDNYLKDLRKQHDQLRLFDIPNTMAEHGDVRSIAGTFKQFSRCTLTSDLHVKVIADKQSMHRWLEDGGNGALIVPTVNAGTLKAFVKEQLINGVVIPDDIINVSPFSRAVLYK